MSIKEKIYMSASGLIVFLANLFLYCKLYPGAVLLLPIIGGLFFAIVPWVGGRMIDRGIQRIELWEIGETGKRKTLIRELSAAEIKIVARVLRKHPHKIGDRMISYADIALRIAYKDRKQMIYPVKEDNCCFVLHDKKHGIILKEERAQKVNDIIFD